MRGVFSQKASRLNFKIKNFLFRKSCFQFYEVKEISYEQNVSLSFLSDVFSFNEETL